MRPALPLFIALSAVFPLAMRAGATGPVDAVQQNTQLAPGPDNADTRLTPANSDNRLPFKRDDRVQDRRFTTPELREKKMDPVGDRRAPIDMTEAREKTFVDRKDYPKPEVRERQMSPDNMQMYRDQPKGDMVKKYDLFSKYQNRMTDAKNAAAQRQPKLEKRTTFDKINRFVFQRNSQDGANGNGLVSKAGGGTNATVSGGAQKTGAAPSPGPAPTQ